MNKIQINMKLNKMFAVTEKRYKSILCVIFCTCPFVVKSGIYCLQHLAVLLFSLQQMGLMTLPHKVSGLNDFLCVKVLSISFGY